MIFDVPSALLVPGIEGDVDILIGNMSTNPAEVRIPAVDHLISIEAKCAAADFSDEKRAQGVPFSSQQPRIRKSDKSAGSVKRINGQLKNLARMGFDAVGLLDILPTAPLAGTGIDGQDWVAAADATSRARATVAEILNARLRSDAPYWHFCWHIGAISGKPEHQAGSSLIELQRRPSTNLDGPHQHRDRAENAVLLRRNLLKLLASLPPSPLVTPLWHFEASGRFQALLPP